MKSVYTSQATKIEKGALMSICANLPLGEKIKRVRKSKGFSQQNIGHDLGKSPSFINRLERGQADYTDELLEGIKKSLEIENAPLQEHEAKIYLDRLCICNDLVTASRMAEAEAMLGEMFPIEALPYEHELILLSDLVKARTVFEKDDFGDSMLTSKQVALLKATQHKLDQLVSLAEKISPLVLQLYHDVKGTYYLVQSDLKNALIHYKKAYGIKTEEVRTTSKIARAIGRCYASLCKPFHAIWYLNQSRTIFSGERSDSHNPGVGAELAICYELIGEFEQAEELYEANIAAIRGINNNRIDLSKALINISGLHNRMGKYELAIKQIDQVIAQTKDIKWLYLTAIANKLDAFRRQQRMAEFDELFKHAISESEGDKEFVQAFETLAHLTTIKENASVEYLETVALPLLTSMEKAHFVGLGLLIEVCKALEAQYKKKRQVKKANAIAAVLRDVYEVMIFS